MAEKTHRKKGGFIESKRHVEDTQSYGMPLLGKTVREDLDFVIGEIPQSLLSGEAVKLTGLGTFEVRKRADRLGLNPKTGESLLFKSHHVVVFCPTRPFWGEGKDKENLV